MLSALPQAILQKWDFLKYLKPLWLWIKKIAHLIEGMALSTIKTKTKTKGVLTMKEITYTKQGDYLIPDLTLPEQPEVTLGRWSQMRRTYLKQHHKILYYNLLTKGILTQHLAEVQERATDLEESLVKQMAAKAGLTEQMKAENMMKWVGLMNNIRNSAQEIVKEQIIFA